MSPKTRRLAKRNRDAEARALSLRCLLAGEVGFISGVTLHDADEPKHPWARRADELQRAECRV